MAHNLSTANGKTSFFYYGEAPWHGLGQHLDNPATAQEAIHAAGLGYEVQLTPIATFDGLTVEGRRAVVRYDNQTVLGVVSDRYVPVQNSHAFGFLDAVVADSGLRYHTAGALGRGEKIFLLAKLPESIRVKNSDDLVDKFLLLTNAHDGSAALRVFFTPIRVVCQNTLSMAERQGHGQGVSILHKGNLEGKILEAQRVLGLAQRFYDDAAYQIDRLASYYPSVTELGIYFKSLYPDPDEDKNNSRAVRIREELHRLFEEGVGHDMPQIPPFGLDRVQRRHGTGRSSAVGQGTRRPTASQQPSPIDLVGQRRQAERAGLESRPGNDRKQLKPLKNGVPSSAGGTSFTFIQPTKRVLCPPSPSSAGSPVQFSTRTDAITATHVAERLFPQMETENETCGPNAWRFLPGVRESNRSRRIFLTTPAG